ncbi:hypothetical protein ABT317_27970, partial [Streptomyces carpinensis]
MPTLTLPRTLGSRIGAAAALTALTVAGATWLATPVAKAVGEGGDIKIHRVGVPFGVSKDDPMVCRFYLDAVNFGDLTTVAYTIQAQPPLPTSATVSGTVALGLNTGAGHTDPLGLADGDYRLTWTIGTAPKAKIFRVNCRDDHERHDGREGPNGQIQDPGHDDADPGRDDNDQHGWAPGRHDGPQGPKGGVHAGG